MNNPTTDTIYKFIESYVQLHGYPPSLREIAIGCYVGTSSVLRHLDKLEAWGWISREPGRARGMKLLINPNIHAAKH